MQTKCYITSHSLLCNQGDNESEIIANVQNITEDNYEVLMTQLLSKRPYYALQSSFKSEKEKFYFCIQKVVRECIEKANLTPQEQEELAIFIGSTSMGISMNEETNALYKKGQSPLEFNHLEYGSIGSYVESITHSKQKALIFSTACTSSVNALCYASKLIINKQIKRALVLGVELFNQSTFDGFSSLMLLSKEKIYRPFDAKSDGIILGEACSAMILDAVPQSENDFYYVGSHNICDIYSETTSNPSGEPIFQTMDKALQNAQMSLCDIDFIKAHATGSENNNISEANAIALLFDKHKCITPLTAIKPLIGHTLGASGTNEIALILSCLKNGFIPQTLGFQNPAEGVIFAPIANPIALKNEKMSVLFNFVAFGGNNTSVILSNRQGV